MITFSENQDLPVIYPEGSDPNKKYKFVQVMVPKSQVEPEPPVEEPEPLPEPKPEEPIETLPTSGRIDVLQNWSTDPKQGVRSVFKESYSDFIDNLLESYASINQ